MMAERAKFQTVKITKESYDNLFRIMEHVVRHGIEGKLPRRVEAILMSGQRRGVMTIGTVLEAAVCLLKLFVEGKVEKVGT